MNCQECGMNVAANEYHPYAACVLYKHLHQREKVRALLDEVRRQGAEAKLKRTIGVISQLQWSWVEQMGWHNKAPLEYLMLICSEVGEAANECRNEHPTDRLGEELADVILRTMDMAVQFGFDLEREIERKMAINEERGTRGRSK